MVQKHISSEVFASIMNLNFKKNLYCVLAMIAVEILIISILDLPLLFNTRAVIPALSLYYFLLHLAVLALSAAAAVPYILIRLFKIRFSTTQKRIYLNAYAGLILLLVALIASLDQISSGQIIVYLIAYFIIISVYYIPLPDYFFANTIPMTVLILGIIHFQKDQTLIFSNIVNLSFFSVFGFVITQISYRTGSSDIDRKQIIEKRNAVMETELDIARSLQLQIVPSAAPFPAISSAYIPMNKIGGDFFDYLEIKKSQAVGIFISDVSGHGVPAALITCMIKTAILNAEEFLEDPAGLLMHLNSIMLKQTQGNFITAFYGVYYKTEKRLVFANAGHNNPCSITSSGIRYLPDTNRSLPLAITGNKELIDRNMLYQNLEISLENVEKLVFYTDGFADAQSEDRAGDSFEDARMREAFIENAHQSPQIFIQNVIDNLKEYHGSDSFEDDVCLICLDI